MASSITQARQGTLYLMCGGKPEVFERAKPLLTKLSNDGQLMRYIGPAGKAAEVKALVNMVMNINTAGLAEGLGLGAALGIDLPMLREVFSQTGANWLEDIQHAADAGRFTSSVRTEQAKEFTSLNAERNIVNSFNGTEGFRDMGNFDSWQGITPLYSQRIV